MYIPRDVTDQIFVATDEPRAAFIPSGEPDQPLGLTVCFNMAALDVFLGGVWYGMKALEQDPSHEAQALLGYLRQLTVDLTQPFVAAVDQATAS